MKYDVIVIGAGIAGLTSAALLSKRDMKVLLVDAQYKVGGASGIFKRGETIFDQGASMLFGFGELGFNPHRFVFNALEEDFDVIKHEHLYAINFGDKRVIFYYDLDRFTDQLGDLFPNERLNIKRFYKDIKEIYDKVIAEKPTYVTPDVVKKVEASKQLFKHPIAYMKFLSYLNISAEKLLKKYFTDPEIFKFFDKITSTYCYTTVKETPAIMAAIMFIDNHVGGGYYPLNSTLQLVGKLEKVIEEHHGDVLLDSKVSSILVQQNKAVGIQLDDGRMIKSERVIYSGNVWALYNDLLPIDLNKQKKVSKLVPTYSSVVLYALVKDHVIDEKALPIEMLLDGLNDIDEGELTVYILSKADPSICPKGYHTIMCIGPSLNDWDIDRVEYLKLKSKEKERILNVLERRFPHFKDNIAHVELSTPKTIEKYCLKYKGSVAGPKQQLGQHMLKRLKIRNKIKNLYCSGESTVMGTGTPAVTVSGISAANLILRDLGLEEYDYEKNQKNYVHIVEPTQNPLSRIKDEKTIELIQQAKVCAYCEHPVCEVKCPYHFPIRNVNLKLSVNNIVGTKKIISEEASMMCFECKDPICQRVCVQNKINQPVEIQNIITGIKAL